MLPLVDEHGIVVGQARRSWCHGPEKPLHPVVHLHILNRAGDLYLQKRSMTKDLLPGYWDTAVGGHVDYGEQIEEALLREAGEELGFYDFNPIYLGTYVFESMIVAIAIFALTLTHTDEAGVTRTGLQGLAVYLTPNFEGEFKQFRSALQALL